MRLGVRGRPIRVLWSLRRTWAVEGSLDVHFDAPGGVVLSKPGEVQTRRRCFATRGFDRQLLLAIILKGREGVVTKTYFIYIYIYILFYG